MLNFKHTKYTYECGTDEAGRGCLAGPVTAAADVWPHPERGAHQRAVLSRPPVHAAAARPAK